MVLSGYPQNSKPLSSNIIKWPQCIRIWNSIILYSFPEVLLPKVRWNLKITPKQSSKRLLNQTWITLGSFAVTFQGINRGYCYPSARKNIMTSFQNGVVSGSLRLVTLKISIYRSSTNRAHAKKLGSWLVVLHTSRRNVLASRGRCKRHGILSMTQKNGTLSLPWTTFTECREWQAFIVQHLGRGSD